MKKGVVFLKKRIDIYQFIAFTFTCLFGSLLHFLYDISGNQKLIAVFSAVNESTWEHMKIMFFPLFASSLILSRLLKDRRDFWLIKFKGLIISLSLIPILFYSYKGILGFNVDLINVAIFYISAAMGYIYETRLFSKQESAVKNSKYFIFYCLIGLLFVVFTFFTPRLGVFLDPLSKTYGINA